jgi:hypothetical protein
MLTNCRKLFLIIFVLTSFTLSLCMRGSLCAECRGKLDISSAYVHIDVLESNVTVHRMNVPAFKSDLSWNIFQGITLKPTVLYGSNKGNKDKIFQVGSGLGLFLPIHSLISLTPIAGVNWGYVRTAFNTPVAPFETIKIIEKFRSISPYIALETTLNICQSLRLSGSVQYSWSRTDTVIKHIGKQKSHSEGFSYSGQIESDLNPCTSLNLGGTYNVSLTKEKHGFRIWGVKAGVVYWF